LASGNFLNVAAGARWSPDGKWLAFTSNLKRAEPDQPTDLTVVLRSTETGKEQAFSVPVRSAGGAGAFTWYPDSKKLLLSEYPSAGTRPFRWLDFTTGEVKMVFEAPLQGDRILSAVISPDGRFVYYSSNEGDRPSAADHVTRLVRRDLESGEEREVFRMMTYGQGLYDLTASPDGQHVAFVVVKRGSGSTAWVASTSVGEPREIWPEWKGKWNYLSAGGALAWTPDGKGLLVSMPEAPGNQLYYLPLDGGQPHRIGIAMRSILWANLKSDGRTIAFSGSNSTSNILSLKTSLVVGVGGK
jgi:Tol biopolymer transport system component